MSDALVIEAVRKSVTVDCSVEDAFRVFTTEIGTWWPTERHSIHGSELREVLFEAREGGEVYEISTNDEKGHWATVLAWEPPNRLVLAWNTGRTDPVATELEIRFLADGERTRVELEHRNLERHGEGWEGMREGVAGADLAVGIPGRLRHPDRAGGPGHGVERGRQPSRAPDGLDRSVPVHVLVGLPVRGDDDARPAQVLADASLELVGAGLSLDVPALALLDGGPAQGPKDAPVRAFGLRWHRLPIVRGGAKTRDRGFHPARLPELPGAVSAAAARRGPDHGGSGPPSASGAPPWRARPEPPARRTASAPGRRAGTGAAPRSARRC